MTKQNKKFTNHFTWNKRLWLVVPFALLTILLVIIPLVMVIVQSFIPVDGGAVNDNWSIVTGTIWEKIGKSLYISIAATIISIVLAYPFCYFLSFSKSKLFKSVILLTITAPIWSSLLIKLIGLKTFFDVINGELNSTYGDIFTIIGITYMYVPFMIIPLYTTLEAMPRSLIDASKDLGNNGIRTFFYIVVPYTKNALFSGISLVLLPAFTSVAIPAFLNNANSGDMIGNIIIDQGQNGLESKIAIARASALSLLVSIIMFLVYGLIVLSPKMYRSIMRYKSKLEMRVKHE